MFIVTATRKKEPSIKPNFEVLGQKFSKLAFTAFATTTLVISCDAAVASGGNKNEISWTFPVIPEDGFVYYVPPLFLFISLISSFVSIFKAYHMLKGLGKIPISAVQPILNLVTHCLPEEYERHLLDIHNQWLQEDIPKWIVQLKILGYFLATRWAIILIKLQAFFSSNRII
jgi:hypothetical protein